MLKAKLIFMHLTTVPHTSVNSNNQSLHISACCISAEKSKYRLVFTVALYYPVKKSCRNIYTRVPL